MQATVNIPDELAILLASDEASLSRAAIEALAIEGVRSERLSVAEARELLDISTRDEMDEFLRAHGVTFEMTRDEIEQDKRVALAFTAR